MKRILKSLLALTLLASATTYCAQRSGNSIDGCCRECCETESCSYCCRNCCLGPCDGYPFLLYRSQGRNAARELVGWQQFINKYGQDCRYGAFTLAVEYTRTMREERITQFLFGSDLINCCELLIQGDTPEGNAHERNPRAWQASYFGLPSNYSSKVTFCPRIENVVIDLDYYLGLDEYTEGLYIKINAPIAWTRWQLCMREQVIDDAEQQTIPAGFLSNAEIPRADLPATFSRVMSGDVRFGDVQSPMKYGLMNNCRCTKARIAEIDFSLGYNWCLKEDCHSGGFLYFAAPTGNRPCARYLFEPVVGNGKHWEVGAGYSGSYILWRNEDCEDRYIGVWIEGTVSHLFRDWQCRSFDFCGKPNSRYMLLAQMGENRDEVQVGATALTAEVASYQYKESLIPAINWTTFEVGVSIDVQADIAFKIGCVRDNWTLDLGYNFWARTGEKFTLDNCLCNDGNRYALKGNGYMYGTYNGADSPIPVPFSQGLANIQGGVADNGTTNLHIDNMQLAWNSLGTALTSVAGGGQIYASEPPLLVARTHLNTGKSPSSITHKFFGHIGYARKDNECNKYLPFIGVGGEAEFAMDNYKECCCNCCNSCDSCNSCYADTTIPTLVTGGDLQCTDRCNKDCCNCKKRGGISQWGVWLKCGIAFE